ncbi:SpcZ [Streptomyces sp. NBC_00878]|uniref:SpcZ n=1 Tax=Streptomyces sp. NBC_00878 TaxID=2975854 RepID=UPI00225A16FA|nr:SpcZ [Streptomyces sp. NBC_00878]MCX4903726.1 SpcZ [Streptomyces sp. NBC_00878]
MTTTEAKDFRALLAGVTPRREHGPPPAWFRQAAAVLYEGQEPTRRDTWARELRTALSRSGGRVPLTVTHAWHARTVLPLLAETATRLGQDTAPYEALAAVHHDALTDRTPSASSWTAALEPALRRIYRAAFAYAEAYTTAHDNARAYALANGFTPADADTYGRDYADQTTEPNARAFATANTTANARATATAYATSDPDAYARTFPGARTRAYVRAAAATLPENTPGGTSRHTSCDRIADGLLDQLNRTRA